jgi:hypothetical protein
LSKKEMNSLTLAAWVNIEGLSPGFHGLLLAAGASKPGDLNWQFTKDGRFYLGVVSKRSENPKWRLPRESMNHWCLLATVCDAATNKMSNYFNGKSVDTVTTFQFSPLQFRAGTIGTWYDANDNDPKHNSSLNGLMDELMIFESALPADEIQRIYDAGKP